MRFFLKSFRPYLDIRGADGGAHSGDDHPGGGCAAEERERRAEIKGGAEMEQVAVRWRSEFI